jgi:hypothetical protein
MVIVRTELLSSTFSYVSLHLCVPFPLCYNNHICIQCEYITSTQLMQFSLVFYCIYSYMFRPHYLAIFRLSVRRCSYIVPLYYIILYTTTTWTTCILQLYIAVRDLLFSCIVGARKSRMAIYSCNIDIVVVYNTVVLCKNISSQIAWRWPNSVAETCSYKYNKTPVKIVLVVLTLCTHIVYIGFSYVRGTLARSNKLTSTVEHNYHL